MTAIDLQPLLSWLVRKPGIRHAVLAVADAEGTPLWAAAAGEADPSGRPMTLDTPYFIASITKLYIAAVIMRLHEADRIKLDEPFLTYMPKGVADGIHKLGASDHTPEITVRHLLSHTSGLPDYLEDKPGSGRRFIERALAESDRRFDIEEICHFVRVNLTPRFVPQPFSSGQRIRARYSDTNFRLLIAVIETVTGRPWSEAVAAELAEPLGLNNTWVPGAQPPAGSPLPASIWNGEEPFERPRLLESLGDLYSNVSDQIRFIRNLLSGKAFRNPETSTLMRRDWNSLAFEPLSPRLPGWPIKYGLGMMHFRLPGWLMPFGPVPAVIGHTGSTGCWLFHCPELDVYICGNVSQINAGSVPFRIVPKILKALPVTGKSPSA